MVGKLTFSTYSLHTLPAEIMRQVYTIFTLDSSPREMALTFALGTFISLLPTPGLNLLAATALLAHFKQLNKAAMVAAVSFWNVLLLAPVYALSYQIGSFLSEHITLSFLLGNLIVTVGLTAVAYLVVLALTHSYRRHTARHI